MTEHWTRTQTEMEQAILAGLPRVDAHLAACEERAFRVLLRAWLYDEGVVPVRVIAERAGIARSSATNVRGILARKGLLSGHESGRRRRCHGETIQYDICALPTGFNFNMPPPPLAKRRPSGEAYRYAKPAPEAKPAPVPSPAVKEESFIRPPSKEQLMGKTYGRL